MCGRYDLNATALELAAHFAAKLAAGGDPSDAATAVAADANSGWRSRYNIAPQQSNPVVVRQQGGHNQIELMKWGLVPSWSRDPKLPYSTINARAETITSKPTFRKPLATQRCLVPATGYFEWVQGGQQGKQPYRIRLQDEEMDGADSIFAFAGLYDIWHGSGGQELRTYTIVTTQANEALSAIHSRMPVILPRDAEGAWLDPNNTDAEILVSLLQPCPEDLMTAYPVSTLVNKPTNDGRHLIEALGGAWLTPPVGIGVSPTLPS
jgi:putative SOS response-associated peptidase YedK